MTRPSAKYLAAVDSCTRCPDRPTIHPDGMGTSTDSEHVVLAYTCGAGHAWQRTFRRSDLNDGKAEASTARRRHLAALPVITTTTANDCTTTIDCADESNLLSKAARQPSPWTCWNPDRRAWQPR